MKKQDTSFKFVIGNLSDNDPFTRLMTMEGNNITEHIYKTETKDILLAQAECLRALSDYANKKADEFEKASKITA
jgi:hypothetical protein